MVQATGSTLVSTPSDDRITVLYKHDSVPRVTQSTVWLWREGRGTVRGSDVDPDDPGAGARVAFEYLDPRQGLVIEVLHTAASPESVEVTGTVMAYPKGHTRHRGGRRDHPVAVRRRHPRHGPHAHHPSGAANRLGRGVEPKSRSDSRRDSHERATTNPAVTGATAARRRPPSVESLSRCCFGRDAEVDMMLGRARASCVNRGRRVR